MEIKKELLGLALAGTILSPSCATTQNTQKQREQVIAKVRTVLKPMIFCSASKDEVNQTAKTRCVQNTDMYRENGTHCVSCDVEKEIIE
jgi:hypothetical protein